MPALAEVQSRVMDALLHGADGAVPLLIDDAGGLGATRRLQVYRNNVFESLAEALAAVYPVVKKLVGESFFRQLARRYIRAHPSRSGSLLEFGAQLPDHLRGLDALAGLPYLGDVAALEWAYHTVYHAAEQPALELTALTALPAAQHLSLRLQLQPCARLVASPYPVLAIWQANQPGAAADAPPISLDDGGDHVLVVQRALALEFRRLGATEHRWLQALANGCTLAEATALALDTDPAFDLGAALALHFHHGLFAGYSVDGAADAPAGAMP